jgi:hypothetical protein
VIKFTTVPAEPKPTGAVVSRAPKMWIGGQDEFCRGARGLARAKGRERRRVAGFGNMMIVAMERD